MQLGGTYAHAIDSYYYNRFEALNIVYTESDNVSCFSRGTIYGSKGSGDTISTPSRYRSPVYLEKTKSTYYKELVCYDISDNLNTAVLLLGGERERRPSPGAVHKIPLDENGEGVLLLPASEQWMKHSGFT